MWGDGGSLSQLSGTREGRHQQHKFLSSLAYDIKAFFPQIYPEEAKVLVTPFLAVASSHGDDGKTQKESHELEAKALSHQGPAGT